VVCEYLLFKPTFSTVDTDVFRKHNLFILSNAIAHLDRFTKQELINDNNIILKTMILFRIKYIYIYEDLQKL
jgi:hypothetical protein